MTELDAQRLKEKLLRQRQEIFTSMQDLETEWQVLSEHEIETGDQAQKADLTSIFLITTEPQLTSKFSEEQGVYLRQHGQVA